MLRTLDIILIVIMTAVAAVTYTIKHNAEEKLNSVRKLEAEIRLERDTIDLLKADWALLTQPNRLTKLITAYTTELQLVPTESTQLAKPSELPMKTADLPQPEDLVAAKIAELSGIPSDKIADDAKPAKKKISRKRPPTS